LYKLKDNFYFIKYGIQNLYIWFPIIWKDRDWDHEYLYEIIELKIKNMLILQKKHGEFTYNTLIIRDMKICLKLLDRIINDHYMDERNNYVSHKHSFVRIENSDLFEIESDLIKNNLSTYINKYPLDMKKTYSYYYKILKKYDNDMNDERTQERLTLYCAQLRKEKAKQLLFRILGDKVENWCL